MSEETGELICINCGVPQEADEVRDGESCNNCNSSELRHKESWLEEVEQ